MRRSRGRRIAVAPPFKLLVARQRDVFATVKVPRATASHNDWARADFSNLDVLPRLLLSQEADLHQVVLLQTFPPAVICRCMLELQPLP